VKINESLQLALKYNVQGQWQKAENIFKEILKVDSNNFEALYHLGDLYSHLGKIDSAIEYFKKASRINPSDAHAHYNLGLCLQDNGQFDEAISCYQSAIKFNLNYFGLFNNLGLALQETGQYDEAVSCYQKALDLNPKFVEAHYNLGNVLQETGKYDEAISCYQKALQLDPDYTDARWNLSLVLLLTGDFTQGWEEYEWRWKLKDKEQYHFSQPLWNGADITGCTILLHAEQGFGDTIQFIRYASLVAERCKRVIVQCQKELAPLLKSVEGVDHIFIQGEQLPEFDLHCPLLNLPSIFNTNLSNIPAKIPYITLDTGFLEKWKEKIRKDNSKIRIGLVWSGNPIHKKDHKRSCRLDMFSPFADIENVAFF
jgi:tetratricopeptide (TPR) repeat protein